MHFRACADEAKGSESIARTRQGNAESQGSAATRPDLPEPPRETPASPGAGSAPARAGGKPKAPFNNLSDTASPPWHGPAASRIPCPAGPRVPYPVSRRTPCPVSPVPQDPVSRNTRPAESHVPHTPHLSPPFPSARTRPRPRIPTPAAMSRPLLRRAPGPPRARPGP